MFVASIIFLCIAVVLLAYFIVEMNKCVKLHNPGQDKYKIEGKERRNFLIYAGANGVALALAGVFYIISKDFIINLGTVIAVILGALIFGAALCAGIGAFMLYYYKLDLDEKQRKVCSFMWPLSIVAALLGLWIYTEGIAVNEEIYPLISGFTFGNGWIHGNEYVTGFKVKFYGILIVLGALLCYAITDHMTYQKFKRHGLIDTLFVVAFIFGILGARLWYCIVLEPGLISEYGFGYVFTGIVDGGLAIQGGAILGIISGVTFMLLFRKYIDVRFMMDVAIPTILLAQVIGRWGNFFNQEVYGMATSKEALWFLPTIVRENMFIDGAYRVPLFFIEGIMNLAGYFFIRYFLGKVCKFHVGLGYQASFYLVWYGMVRAVLELLRDARFRYMNSWYIAFGMIAGGLALFGVMYLVHYLRASKGLEDEFGTK